MMTEINNKLDPAALAAFLSDLMTLPTFAGKKKVTKDTIYNSIKSGKIDEKDLIWIDTFQFISWNQYKHLTFKQVRNKKNPNK
jgi:hypothetical protein